MPALAPIVLKDGASTPVDHTFTPSKIDASGVASLQERVSGIPVGYPTLTASVRGPTPQSSNYKVVLKLTEPKVVTTTDSSGKAVTSVDYTNIGTIELVISNRSLKQERKDLRILLSNALKDPAFVSIIDDLENFY